MKRLALLVLLAAFLSPHASAGPISCTDVGTSASDEIIGGPYRDVICARRGADYAIGKGGSDIVRGGRGADTLVGGDGSDSIRGRLGNDDLFASDGNPGDVIYGGWGFDRCYGDQGDTFVDCEHIVRVKT